MKEWTYDYSDELKMKFAYRVNNGRMDVYTEDKVHYTHEEITRIKNAGCKITAEPHLIKKMFDGKITNVRRKTEDGRSIRTDTEETGIY